jgi:DNA-binding transcriptional ArsR family regulator
MGFFPSTHRHVDVIVICFKLKEQIFVLRKVCCSFAAGSQSCSLLVLSVSICTLSVHVLIVCCACDCYVEQLRRKGSAAFAGKQGFITLRDLFRWGERYRLAGEKEGTFYDWDQHIADEGYLVLAGRVRKQEECHVIQDVIKRHINRTVDPQRLFTCKL